MGEDMTDAKQKALTLGRYRLGDDEVWITSDGAVHIGVGGSVVVKTPRAWHALASHGAEPAKGADAPLPCPFCGEQPTLVEYEEMDGLPAATIDCRACDQAGTRVHTSAAEVTAAWNRRASPIKAEVTTGDVPIAPFVPEHWRHVKTGRTYWVLMHAVAEASMDAVVVYKADRDGIVFTRPMSEFYDGRFEQFPDAAAGSLQSIGDCNGIHASPAEGEVTTGEAELTDKELMRILRDADGGEALSVRLRPLYDTVWKDGIDIEQPSYLYKTLARRIAKSENASLRAKLDERELMIDRLDNALATIQQWDCLNPPRADLLGDLPWLRGIVDNARAARQSAQAASQPSNPET